MNITPHFHLLKLLLFPLEDVKNKDLVLGCSAACKESYLGQDGGISVLERREEKIQTHTHTNTQNERERVLSVSERDSKTICGRLTF